MLTKPRYSIKEMMLWTRRETLFFLSLSLVVVVLYDVLNLTFFKVPWTPLALIGTAVAFIIGFQNNAAYGRIWEARKIWGGIVNSSRSWAMKSRDFISNRHAINPLTDEELNAIRKQLVFRHIAWLTALRHAMRQSKSWETFNNYRTNREWSDLMHNPERVSSLHDDLLEYLSPEELEHVMSKGNKATALLFLQSKHIKELHESNYLWEFSFLELESLPETLFDLQRKAVFKGHQVKE